MGFQDETVAFGGIAIGGKDVVLHAPPIGSGVSVIALDPERQVGGIAHMPYPERGAKLASESDHRIESLFNLMVAAGAMVESVRVVIVGGAEHAGEADHPLSEFAAHGLERVRVDIAEARPAEVSEDVGGYFARKCTLKIKTGHLTVESGPASETVFLMGRVA